MASSSFSVLEKPVELDKRVLYEIIERKQSNIEFLDESDNEHNQCGKKSSKAEIYHEQQNQPDDYIVLGISGSLNSVNVNKDFSAWFDEEDGLHKPSPKECRPDDVPTISFFGKFAIYTSQSDFPIRWRTTKSEELFASYYTKKKTNYQNEKYAHALWAEDESKLDDSLHTSIYKMKKNIIVCRN